MAYARKVEIKIWEFPNFNELCPICHGQNCPIRIGYYYRLVFDIRRDIFISIPIARYRCRRKKKPVIKDLTFSLLPDCLIPYFTPTINAYIQIIEDKMIHKVSDKKILAGLYKSIFSKSFNLSVKTLSRFYKLFIQTIIKLKIFFKDKKDIAPPNLQRFTANDFVGFIKSFSFSENYRGGMGLSNFYYVENGSYLKNAGFLFGTAYQFV